MPYLSYAKDFQGVTDVLLRDPDRYLPIVQFLETVLRKDSEFSPAERELIAAYVSMFNSCQFCYGTHEAVATALGVGKVVLKALETDLASAPIDERLRPVFALAKKLTETPSKVVQADIRAVIDAGWSEQSIEDIIGVTSIFAFMNRLADGFGLKGTPDYCAQVGAGLSQYGYEPFVRSALEQKGKTTAS